jgi:replicative DNA helicase
MGSFENAIITKIIDEKAIREVVKKKITPEFFSDSTARAAYIYLLSCFNNPEHGEVPSWKMFSHDFEDFQPERMEDPLPALLEKIRAQKLYSDLAEAMSAIVEESDADPQKGLDLLRASAITLSQRFSDDATSATVGSLIPQMRVEYQAMKEGRTGLKGRPWPWAALNGATMGGQNGHFVLFYGRPKVGKTWSALKSIQHMTNADPSCRALVISQEMLPQELCRRYIALQANIDYKLYQRGRLDAEQEARFYAALEEFENQDRIVFDRLSSTGASALSELAAKADEHGAHIVFVDGLYFLGEDWKEIAVITRGLAQFAQTSQRLMIGTTQQNRSQGEKGKKKGGPGEANDFGYGDSFAQDCHCAIRVTADIEDKRQRRVKHFTSALREGEPAYYAVNMHLCSNMEQVEQIPLTDDEEEIDTAANDESIMPSGDAPAPVPGKVPGKQAAAVPGKIPGKLPGKIPGKVAAAPPGKPPSVPGKFPGKTNITRLPPGKPPRKLAA